VKGAKPYGSMGTAKYNSFIFFTDETTRFKLLGKFLLLYTLRGE
jgi:hypothetical protein